MVDQTLRPGMTVMSNELYQKLLKTAQYAEIMKAHTSDETKPRQLRGIHVRKHDPQRCFDFLADEV